MTCGGALSDQTFLGKEDVLEGGIVGRSNCCGDVVFLNHGHTLLQITMGIILLFGVLGNK